MASDKKDFERRVARIEKRKLAIAEHGARRKVGKDGLVEYVPRRGPVSFGFPWRAVLLLALFLFAGKVGLFRALGPEAYAAKLGELEQGSGIDQLGARVMTVDPATQWISDQLDRFL